MRRRPSTLRKDEALLSVLALLCLAPLTAHAQGRFAAAGHLATARMNHTATLLADGRVLVAGGRGTDGLSTLASVELFDPKTKTWKPGAAMHVARSHHTATLLADGRVLVAGGTTHEAKGDTARYVALSSAEVYDAKKNAWTPVAAMAEGRNGHSATLLEDGTVLIAGGAREQRSHLASVERFDPAAGAWRTEKPLNVARWLHAAVRLVDGSVVVLGGRSNAPDGGKGAGASIASVERFDPKTNAWQLAPEMTEPRQRTGAVALKAQDAVVVIGGQTATSSTNYAETWKPGADAWAPLENHLSMSLSAHTATLLPSGDILVVGGEPPNAVDTTRAQRWVAATKQWCLAGALKASRKLHTATLLGDGQVLVVGGLSSGMAEPTAELWQDAKGACEEPPGVSLGGW